MKWSVQAWKEMYPIYNKILKLSFIQELMSGNLPMEKFLFYLQQDALYLKEFGKVLAVIGTKTKETAHREAFLTFAAETITVESALHSSYLKHCSGYLPVGQAPFCTLYTGFLAQQVLFYPVEMAMAAVLPCFWIYKEVGEYITINATCLNNPYQQWIDAYKSEAFALSVGKAISICNEVAIESPFKEQMTEKAVMATQMEWMFWEGAYHMEKWPI